MKRKLMPILLSLCLTACSANVVFAQCTGNNSSCEDMWKEMACSAFCQQKLQTNLNIINANLQTYLNQFLQWPVNETNTNATVEEQNNVSVDKEDNATKTICKENCCNNTQCKKTQATIPQTTATNDTNEETTNVEKVTNVLTSEGQQSSLAGQVISLVNQERKAENLGTVAEDSQLMKLAQKKAEDMAQNNYFSHTSPTYGSAFDMMKAAGVSYRTAGENIAMGQKTAESVMNGWMNSSGHRANILNSSYTKIGVGYAKASNGTTYWVQMFLG